MRGNIKFQGLIFRSFFGRFYISWIIDENGELQLRKQTPASGQLVLREGNQEIKIRTVPSTVGKWNDIIVELKKIKPGRYFTLCDA